MKNKLFLILFLPLFALTAFIPYNSKIEQHIKQYAQHQTIQKYNYFKTVNNETKLFVPKDKTDWTKELYYLLEYNALSPQQAEYFDFITETHNNRIKIIAYRKKEYAHKTPLVSQSLLWDTKTEKPLFIRSHIIRKTWFYTQDIESKATFETENGHFYLKRLFQHFYTQIAFFKPREVVIFGKLITQ